ncbi:MAG: M20/M25/M40 family metallo-hydrolase [Clostridia bacterium]|nr:M20/M25/M40 family metallo-hydrolase [Clostridia bacterium]
MQCDKLFDEINRLESDYVKVWEDVCNIESPTNFKEGVDRVGKYFIKMAEDRGFDVELCEQPVSGNAICITMNPQAKAAPVTFSGHIDTVHQVGFFGTPAVKKDSENIYGPGVTDCKGGVVASFFAMDALKNCGFTARPVKLIIQSDEETSSKGSNKQTLDFMCKKAAGSVAFLNAEGSRKGLVTLLRKGIIMYRFSVKGKAIHSSECDKGASAIAEAAHKIIELEKMKNVDGITCNCGIIKGGTVPNTVPEECEFVADIRYWTNQEFEYVKEKINEVCNTVYVEGCSCTVEVDSFRPAMVASEHNDKLLEKANEIFKANGLPELKAASATGGSDASYITECEIPCLDDVGIEGFNIHSIKEYAGIKALGDAAKRLAAVAYCI